MTERTSDGLPLAYDGKAIDWEPWWAAPTLSCVDTSCPGCGDPQPPRMARGRIMIPVPPRLRARWGVERTERPLIRFFAFRCPGCQETRVYDREPPEPRTERMPMIEYMRPVIPMAIEPLGPEERKP